MSQHEEEDTVLLQAELFSQVQAVADAFDRADLDVEGAEILKVTALRGWHRDGEM